MDFYWLTLGTLGAWRVTLLLAMEDGPYGLIARLRRILSKTAFGQVFDCFYCLSLWSAALIAYPLAKSVLHYFYLCLAFSAGAIFLEAIAHRQGNPEPVDGADPVVLGGPLDAPAVRMEETGFRRETRGHAWHVHST